MTDLHDVFRALNQQPSPAAYAAAARQLRASREERRPVRIAVLSSFTIDLLVPYLEVAAAQMGFATDVYVAPFDNVHQELLDPTSGCLQHNPDVVFVAQQLANVCPELTDDFLGLSAEAIDRLFGEFLLRMKSSLESFRQRSSAALVVHNFTIPSEAVLGIDEAMASRSQTRAVRQLNGALAEAVQGVAGAYVLDYDKVAATVGHRHAHDARLWHVGRAPLSAAAMRELALEQAAFIHALCGVPRKCLVLDLDNTLWGGVVGELGPDGIALGATYPGSAFRQFQFVIRQLNRRGVLLAINSKNNFEEAEQVIRSHPAMVLRPENFAAMRINWRDKAENMVELANELNIGLDSLVFVDDDPAERAKMRQLLPAVMTLDMPADATAYVATLLGSRAFDRLSFTHEDRRRGEMYREQREREHVKQSAQSVEEFLRTLQMKVTIQEVDDSSLPRVVDLLHKTNQFNLTTRRHTAAIVAEMIAGKRHGVFCLSVSDRFGDSGIVGVAIVEQRGGIGMLDTLLLSCRVIGRSIETALLAFLADWASAHGMSILEGAFVPTSKNAPAADFYARHGFQQVGQDGAATRWSLTLHGRPFTWPEYIESSPVAQFT